MTPQPDPHARPRSSARRPFRLALTALIAVLSTFSVAAVALGRDADTRGPHQHATRHAGRISHREFVFRQDMRKLWEDHVTWTRLAVISLTTDSPDTSATVGRLLRNQTDIGNAIKPFYGTAAGNQLTTLLREHILIAADLIAAARSRRRRRRRHPVGPLDGERRPDRGLPARREPAPLQARGDAGDDARAPAADHERGARPPAPDWDADVAAYDLIHVQALNMADMLSAGIVAQFPRRFR